MIKKITASRLYIFLYRLFTLEQQNDFVPSSLTYYMILSLIPSLSFLMMLLSQINIDVTYFQNIISPFVSEESVLSQIVFASFFEIKNAGKVLEISLAFFVSLYISSRGIETFIKFVDQNYHLDFNYQGNYFKRKIRAIISSLIIIVFTALLIAFLILLDNIFNFQIAFFNLLFKGLLTIIAILLFINTFYYVALKRKEKYLSLLPGSTFSSIAIAVSITIYQYYLQHFSQYQKTYGVIAELIVFLITIYIIAYLLLCGITLNALIQEKR